MPANIPGPAYRIVTTRLVIRCYNPADAPLLKASVDESLEHLRPWMPWTKYEPTDIQTKINLLRDFRGRFDLGQDFVYGVFNLDETRLLGSSGLHTRPGPGAREIGYWIHQDFINQGLAGELSAALTRTAFEVDGVQRIEIHCDPANVRSAAVPRKLGFTHEATLRKHTRIDEDVFRDTMIWTLLKEDYPSSPCARAEIQAFDAMGRAIL